MLLFPNILSVRDPTSVLHSNKTRVLRTLPCALGIKSKLHHLPQDLPWPDWPLSLLLTSQYVPCLPFKFLATLLLASELSHMLFLPTGLIPMPATPSYSQPPFKSLIQMSLVQGSKYVRFPCYFVSRHLICLPRTYRTYSHCNYNEAYSQLLNVPLLHWFVSSMRGKPCPPPHPQHLGQCPTPVSNSVSIC